MIGFLRLIASPGQDADILIADFEEDDFGQWAVDGEAFGAGPTRVDAKSRPQINGFEGRGFASSFFGGHRSEGELTSPPFVIERRYINFLLGGGKASDIYVGLLSNSTLVRSALPTNLESMEWMSWDVSSLVGQNAQIQIVDDRSGDPHGYLFVDSIYQSNNAKTTPLAIKPLIRELVSAHSLNPDPRRIPTLGVWQKSEYLYVSAGFPELPGFTCDSWCYEIPDIEFIGAGAVEGGIVEMEHRVKRGEHVFRFKTEVIPSSGAVEFIVTPLADPSNAESLPQELPIPNICFQLRRSPRFKSEKPATDNYPEFVERCFIFSEKGLTFLLNTERRKIPARPSDDKENNPPWVQMYVGVWKTPRKPRPDSWADTSSDRYTVPIIGTVSRDRKYLVALAEDSADTMSQAWHDCLHTSPKWQPENAPPSEQVWRMKIYLMENNPDALLARARKDFPKIDDLAKHPAPLGR